MLQEHHVQSSTAIVNCHIEVLARHTQLWHGLLSVELQHTLVFKVGFCWLTETGKLFDFSSLLQRSYFSNQTISHRSYFVWTFLFGFEWLRIGSRVSCTLGKHCTTEPYPQLLFSLPFGSAS